ncbi:mycofactocin biosynthesis peptidyl-dipeptidase MftE [Nocardioides zeae]|uniref:Mycofactocin biosynthesis peptidyl-dipeptidase MftE n=1 Tax=Nocardioides imazamoxiresistens TaxID=3231893 RepID=A0ABU3Q1B6_9ACTN|nr:mycofactocin biosynthesis peptidyl-dipeptidase MftE [Nocardioides zeae]MDT9595288.1 mycofactocin biosynthesis peptidyl-dipeptidase MftE [Nocardioides zeae]
MSPALTARPWPDVTPGALLLVPVGSLEQHGPHLPLDTDSVIAAEVAGRVAAHLLGDEQVLVAPPLTYAASGEHHGFPGTLSIGTDALAHLLVELVRSAQLWTPRVVLVNAHGGNVFALEKAVAQLREEGHDTAWAACATEEVDLHAGRTETSMMLYLRPSAVDLRRAEPGNTASLPDLLPTLMTGGVRAASPNGVLGDPTGASAEEGRTLTAEIVRDVLRRVRHGAPDHRGLLQAPAPGRAGTPESAPSSTA